MLTAGLLISGIGTSALLRNYLVDQIDVRLQAAVQDWETILGPGANPENENCYTSGPYEYFWALYHENGSLKCDNWGVRDPNQRPDLDRLTLEDTINYHGQVTALPSVKDGSDWRIRALPIQHLEDNSKYSLVIGLNLVRTDDTMANYISIFFGFSLIVIIFAAGLTQFLVTSTFTPLRDAEQTAADIANGNFSLRLQHHGSNTEVGRLNKSLNKMLHRIDRALEDRARTIEQMRRFIGDAGHELRTPLVTVRGYAELFRMGAIKDEEKLDQAMERIEKEAIRMGGLVEDLLELARIDQERPMEQQAINMIPLLEEIAMDARAREPDRFITAVIPADLDPTIPERFRINESGEQPIIPQPQEPLPETTVIPVISEDEAKAERTRKVRNKSKNPNSITGSFTGPIAIAGAALGRLRGKRRDDSQEVQPLEDKTPKIQPKEQLPPPLILGDENKVRQVLTNLLSNALRFTPEAESIELQLELLNKNDKVRIRVIDHGEGIPPQIREKIFQRFWRADTSRTRETGGSGLGLAIVNAIVQSHHGQVWVEETPGGGATFVVQFPLLK